MKIIYPLFGVFLAGFAVLYLISCKNKSGAGSQSGIKEDKVTVNMYPELRTKALTITSDELHLKLDSNKTIVYGALMDWDVGEAVATIVAFQTGDVSLYVSAGQIYIGGYAHENVRNAGLAFVNASKGYLSKAKAAENTPLPDKGCVRFYFLTNKGKFTSQETVENIVNKNSEWTQLFDLGNNIITEYRTKIDK